MPSTHFSAVYRTIIWCIVMCIGSPAWADNQSDLRQKLFEMDKVAALADFDTTQEQACINALQSRYHSQYTLNGALAFNESFSQAAYDWLFWKGEGHLQRGLLFTGGIVDRSGAKAGNVICYYAMTDNHLDFQSAYMLPLQTKKADAVGNGHKHAASITLTSKE